VCLAQLPALQVICWGIKTRPLNCNTSATDSSSPSATSEPSRHFEDRNTSKHAATAFVNTTDRNAKENFKPVSAQEILPKVTPSTDCKLRPCKKGAMVKGMIDK